MSPAMVAAAAIKGVFSEVQAGGGVHLTVSDLPQQTESPFRLCASDVDNDGDADLVVVNAVLVSGLAGGGGNSVQVLIAGVEPIPGDINGDGVVNVVDLLALINSWGSCSAPCPPHCPADIAGADCQVNVLDLLMVINNWS